MSTQPTLIAYTVIEKGRGRKSYWHRIGAAWTTKDGGGLSIQLESLPLDGRLMLLPPKAGEAETPADEQAPPHEDVV